MFREFNYGMRPDEIQEFTQNLIAQFKEAGQFEEFAATIGKIWRDEKAFEKKRLEAKLKKVNA
jgi:hypothetical protein